MEKDRDEDLENGTVMEKRWHVCSNRGKKRCRDSDNNAQHCKKVHKSAETVPSDSEEDATNDLPSIPINNSNLCSTSLIPNAPLSIPIDNSLHLTSTSLIPNAPPSIPINNNILPAPPTPLLTSNTKSVSPFLLPDHGVDVSMPEFPEGFDKFIPFDEFLASLPVP